MAPTGSVLFYVLSEISEASLHFEAPREGILIVSRISLTLKIVYRDVSKSDRTICIS